jgi:hypothetical protein
MQEAGDYMALHPLELYQNLDQLQAGSRVALRSKPQSPSEVSSRAKWLPLCELR